MIAHPGLLVNPAEDAGIKVPENIEDFDAREFPHWNVFLNAQIGASMPSPSSHWDNAKVIAGISDDKIRSITMKDLINLGFSIGGPIL